jgi:hypothetical protein
MYAHVIITVIQSRLGCYSRLFVSGQVCFLIIEATSVYWSTCFEMDVLPAEICNLVVGVVTEKTDLKNVRLVSKTLSDAATRVLFSKGYITLPAIEEDPSQVEHLQNILSSPKLSKEVRRLHYTTSLEPNKTVDDYNNDEEATEFTNGMKDALHLVNRFPKVEKLEVEFASYCAVIQEDDYFTMRPEDSVTFRTEVLTTVFAALNDPDHPTTNLKSLSFKNLQNVNDPALVTSTNFLQTLTRISELRLKFLTQQTEAAPEQAYDLPELYDFFAELPRVWLAPAQATLTSLTLHSNDFWGYTPRVDFRALHFSQLRRLELGNFTFTHEWQLEWILSHGETLEVLVLDDCPIIRYMKEYYPLDEEGYILDHKRSVWPAYGVRHVKSEWRYEGRWAAYFEKIEKGLSKLKTFQFGMGEWEDGQNFDGAHWVSVGVHYNMYMGFDRGIGPSPWIQGPDVRDLGDDEEEEEEDEKEDSGDEENGIDIAESVNNSPYDEDEEDLIAYTNLMATLASR